MGRFRYLWRHRTERDCSGYQRGSGFGYSAMRSRRSGIGGSNCKTHVSYLLCSLTPGVCRIYVVSDSNGEWNEAAEADDGPSLSTILASSFS